MGVFNFIVNKLATHLLAKGFYSNSAQASMSETSAVGPLPGTGLLLAGWILGFLFWLFEVIVAVFVSAMLGSILPMAGMISASVLAVPIVLGLIGWLLTLIAWRKAKAGTPPGGLGWVGAIFLLIFTGLIPGIIAIIGMAKAK